MKLPGTVSVYSLNAKRNPDTISKLTLDQLFRGPVAVTRPHNTKHHIINTKLLQI
jgi:hypothetical protein